MPQTVAAPTTTATAHPVLVEVTETRLAWVEADTPDQAAELATAYTTAPGRMNLPLVDASAQTRPLTEDLANWLNAEPDQYDRLDHYFATHTAD